MSCIKKLTTSTYWVWDQSNRKTLGSTRWNWIPYPKFCWIWCVNLEYIFYQKNRDQTAIWQHYHVNPIIAAAVTTLPSTMMSSSKITIITISVTQCFRDGPLPLYPAINAMSQNPMKLYQQVPRHIWESHGRGFWMLSSPNIESSRPKLVLLVFKDKSWTKH